MEKGHSYNGKHWMQDPKNRAKMLKQLSKMKRGQKKRLALAKRIHRAAKFQIAEPKIDKPKQYKDKVKEDKPFVIRSSGWVITLSKDGMQIDYE